MVPMKSDDVRKALVASLGLESSPAAVAAISSFKPRKDPVGPGTHVVSISQTETLKSIQADGVNFYPVYHQ